MNANRNALPPSWPPVRGKLTIFLGAAHGVGKTSAMLTAAQERKERGTDVLVGWLDPNQLRRPVLAAGLESLSPPQHRGGGAMTDNRGMNVEGILRRRPQLVLIDDLAHSNAPGVPRAKRYLDVEAILGAGIDVYTTLNIQEIESFNDVVARITGTRIEEIVPDKFLEQADRVQLVDIPTEELMERFLAEKISTHGKVAEPERFYRPGNLMALRELALRYAAQRVDKRLDEYMRSQDITGPWPVAEKIMVCLSASPFSTQLIRVTRQMAASMKVDWLAVYVDTPSRAPVTEQDHTRIADHLRLAEELGAQIVSITGQDVAQEILVLARKHNVKAIVIGKPRHSRLWEWLHGSVVHRVIRNSPGISVHVIPGTSENKHTGGEAATTGEQRIKWQPYAAASGFIAGLTLVLRFVAPTFDPVNVVLLYMFPVLVSAVKWGLGPSLYAAATGVLVFDFFFVPPFFSFTVADLRYVISFVVFLTVATLTASLASRLRQQLRHARQREVVTAALYALSRQMTAVANLQTVLSSVVLQVSESVGAEVAIFLPHATSEMELVSRSSATSKWGSDDTDLATASWVYRHGELAGRGTNVLRESRDLYVPLRTEVQVHGVLAVHFGEADAVVTADRLRLMEALAGLAAVAISRIKLEEEAKIAHLTAESERLRTALLDSISHELRTPLATIIGSVTGLLDGGEVFSAQDRRELLSTIREGAMRMNRLVTNLLGMVRLESGMLQLRKQWCDVEDILGVALAQVKDSLQERNIRIIAHDPLPLIPVDDVLIEQVLVNILSNAIKYSPAGSEIVVRVEAAADTLAVSVSDQGIGIPAEDAERIFDKFYRADAAHHIPGTGLGLAICKGVVEAHGGTIRARPNPDAGTVVTVFLPMEDPQMDSSADFH